MNNVCAHNFDPLTAVVDTDGREVCPICYEENIQKRSQGDKPCPECGSPMRYRSSDASQVAWWSEHFECSNFNCLHAESLDGGPVIGGSEL